MVWKCSYWENKLSSIEENSICRGNEGKRIKRMHFLTINLCIGAGKGRGFLGKIIVIVIIIWREERSAF